MKIGLYGIGGVYNFGCEAIVRGATKLIRKFYKDSTIIYFSYNYEYDKKALADLNIEIYSIQRERRIVPRAINKVCNYLNTDHHPLLFDFKTMLSMVDEVWSVGGDIYTIPAVLREQKKYPYYNSVIDFCDRAVEAGKKVVLYGASVGPFGDYDKAVVYYVKSLQRYDKILCRETVTLEYLRGLGLANAIFFPDPAFQVRGQVAVDNGNRDGIDSAAEKKIGVNLSPLSLNELYGDHKEDNIIKFAKIMDQVIENFDMKLLFIPHVISQDENDDDLRFQKKIINYMEHKDQTQIADYSKGFLGLKPQIRQCRFVISARMHCGINAIVENIPVIFLSYSSKSIGMCEYIYRDRRWLLDLKEVENELIDKLNEMNTEAVDISTDLLIRNNEIQEECDRLLSVLARENYE